MRSGAHSAWKGANGVKEGITVDFAYLNTTTYDSGNKIVETQPGSTWGDVYEALNQYGVSAIGFQASVVGVGGNMHGFACDGVTNFEVVLPNRAIVNANTDENQDLWKSLNGGPGNFGFVTRFNRVVHESNRFCGTFVTFDLKSRDAGFEAYQRVSENMDNDDASQLIMSFQYASG
ncbi:FAD-binding domain-containing protein [Thozetella sp. PMI_491]|nr:FAD-binding domain-containing protein [Thozetella sp. PMI_491]